ncbi:hypothetical protein ACWGI9_19760 [Streptomyces sp. NPDC054833]
MSEGGELFESAGQFNGVVLVEHGGELAHQFVDVSQFRTVSEQQAEPFLGVQVPTFGRSDDPSGDLEG